MNRRRARMAHGTAVAVLLKDDVCRPVGGVRPAAREGCAAGVDVSAGQQREVPACSPGFCGVLVF